MMYVRNLAAIVLLLSPLTLISYKFLYGEPNAVIPDPDTNATIEWNVTEKTEFKAVFESIAEAGKLSFSELNYNSDSTRNSGNWIEIHNYGDGQINISGYSFTDSNVSHKFTLPNGTILQPDDRIVLAQDVTQFHTQFPGLPALGPMNFGFSNTSETLTLKNVANQVVLSFTYLDSIPWPKASDGYGPTLELVNDESDPKLPTSWFTGCIGGSPTQPYSPCTEQIVFSEINYHSSPTADAGDWVELHNISTSPVNISHWTFKDGNPAHQFMLPSNTILQPDAYLVLYSDFAMFHVRFPNVTNILGPFPFLLKNSSEAIRLFDAQGILYQTVAYSDVAPWPVAADGGGYTLELINNTGIMSDGHNWSVGCFEGSPGTGFTLPCMTTSLENPEQHLQVRIDPNPSSGTLTVSWDQASFPGLMAEMKLYTSLGQLVWSKKDLHPHEKLDLSKQPDGMYYYWIKCGSRYAFGKLILEK